MKDVDNARLFSEGSFYDNGREDIPGYQRAGGYIAHEDAPYFERTDVVMESFDLVPDNDKIYYDVPA